MVLLLIAVIALSQAGCSVGIVLSKPGKKKITKITQGMTKEDVVSYLGAGPVETHDSDVGKIEVYEVKKGIGGWAKFGRSLWHLALDFCTLCIWEIVATPAELLTNKEKTMIKVIYDDKMLVRGVKGI